MYGADGRFSRWALRAGVACALVLFVHLGFAGQTAGQIQQARLNLRFARDASFLHAVERYEPMWPPLYPTLLWGLKRIGIEPVVANELLVITSLLLLWLVARRITTGLSPAVPVALFAIAHANYWNLHLVVSEALLVPLALASVLALLRFQRTPDWSSLLLLSAALSAACVTRTFALFWLVPFFAWIVWPRAGAGRAMAPKLAVGAAAILAPTLLWMAHTYRATGFLTGQDRLGARQWDSAIRHWQGTTDLPHNTWFTLKTLAADFLSPLHYANHPFVDFPWQPEPLEWLCLGAAFAAVVLIVGLRLRSVISGGTAGAETRLLSRAPEALPLQLVLVYLFWTLTLWTAGNNDPIYTRFLYPSYVFVVLAACGAYARLEPGDRAGRLAFVLLAAVYTGAQLTKTLFPAT